MILLYFDSYKSSTESSMRVYIYIYTRIMLIPDTTLIMLERTMYLATMFVVITA